MKFNFRKSITMLFAIAVILCFVCVMFTSCSQEEEMTADTQNTVSIRKPVTLTIYGVTNSSTTPEAIKMVEQKLSHLAETEYSTSLVLKLYTEEEYNQVLDQKYEQIQHGIDVDEFCQQAKKTREKIDKKRTRLLSEQEVEEKTASEAAAKKQKEEQELKKAQELEKAIAEGTATYEAVGENQVDIVFISDYQRYIDSINAQPKSTVVALDEYLSLESKILTDYIHPTLLSASKIGGRTYALPVNKAIESEATYYLFDKQLLEKYPFTEEGADINKLDFTRYIQPFLEAVSINEPGVIPLLSIPDDIQNFDFYNNQVGHPIGVVNPEYGKFAPTNCVNSYNQKYVTDFLNTISDFRTIGYVPDKNTDVTGKRFAVDIRKGTQADVAEWEAQGYVVTVYKKARATTENTMGAMYAISRYSKYPDRCMEVLEMLYTNSEFKNLFTFGIEGTHYEVNPDGKTVKHLNDQYSMDFMKSGNTFIGLLDEGMDVNYVANAVKKNDGIERHAFLAFQPTLEEKDQAVLDFYEKIVFEDKNSIDQDGNNAIVQCIKGESGGQRALGNVIREIKKAPLPEDEGGSEITDIKVFLEGQDGVPSTWAMKFDEYKASIPIPVSFEDQKDLTVYMNQKED